MGAIVAIVPQGCWSELACFILTMGLGQS